MGQRLRCAYRPRLYDGGLSVAVELVLEAPTAVLSMACVAPHALDVLCCSQSLGVAASMRKTHHTLKGVYGIIYLCKGGIDAEGGGSRLSFFCCLERYYREYILLKKSLEDGEDGARERRTRALDAFVANYPLLGPRAAAWRLSEDDRWPPGPCDAGHSWWARC